MMSDVEIVMGAYPRIHAACRAGRVHDEGGQVALTAHQARIVSYLDESDPVMVTELADYMGVTPSTMSLNLKRLETAGFISRSRDPADRRVMNVRLTAVGARVRDRLTMLDADRVDSMLRRLRPPERRMAVEGLALLAEASDALVARSDEYVRSLTGEEDSG